MGDNEVLPAIVYLHEGAFVRRLDGYYDTSAVGCRHGKLDLVWPIAPDPGTAEHEIDGKTPKRVFHVDLDFPEMEIPFATSRKALLEWRGDVLGQAAKSPNGVTEASLQAALETSGTPNVHARRLAPVFAAGATPDVTARLFHRSWLEGMLAKGEAAWPLVIGALVFGILEGWQLADTILPDVAKSPWFSLLLPLALLVFVIILAIKED